MRLTHSDIRTLIRVKQYIDDPANHPIRVSDLITMFDLKASKLSRGFKRIYKTSIYSYYINHAMKHAKSLLDKGYMVKEIALTLGYSNTANFSRAYKKIHGVYPGSNGLHK